VIERGEKNGEANLSAMFFFDQFFFSFWK